MTNTRGAKRLLPAGLCFVILGLMLAPGALAYRPAKVTLTVPAAVNENAPIPFSWTGKHLGRGHKLVIQRPVGTAHTWRSTWRLPSNSGSSQFAGLPLGTYRLRIADLIGRRVLARQVIIINVYGPVPFSTLFGDYGEGPGVYTTPSASFPYVYWFGAGQPNSPSTGFSVKNNHCLSVHVAFVPAYPGPAAGNRSTITGTVAVVQESRDPVSASAPYDGLGSVDAELVPGQSWAITASYTGDFEPRIYLNGYAVCNSREPFL
jgi:hypothetical protein